MMFASPMDAHQSLPLLSRARLRVGLNLVLGAALAGAAVGATAAVATSPVQDGGRPDQVFRLHPRSGKLTKVSGQVTENSLDTVVIERDGKQTKVDSDQVVRIVWGSTTTAFRDGQAYLGRKDFENAVARFRIAATDASGREVVQAAARLQAAEALVAWGAVDPNRFTEAVSEVERFLTDHPSNRQVPVARRIKGRAQWLAGDPASAAATYKALYEQGASDPPAPGYDRALCLDAGLSAAQAFVAAKNTLSARELFKALEASYRAAAQDAEGGSDLRARLMAGQGIASVGEGWCLVASGSATQAIRFFEARVGRPELGSAGRSSARLGLAEALLADSQARKAQLAFAEVSALDHTSRDRVARALVGLADSALRLADSDAKANARLWLTKATDQYGDTPSAATAAAMLSRL
jgi:tetratricopeptide (TPR) repeat protein